MILPVYNVEEYLDRCIDSIKKQSLKEIQIILVNDGSTDNSLSICEKHAKNDSRIKVINKPNGGVSSARNIGIKYADGDYIGFVDPDDWIESDMYQNMYTQIKQNDADVCLCNYVTESSAKIKHIDLNIDKKLLHNDEIINEIILNLISPSSINSGAQYLMGNVWRLLVKKDLIRTNSIQFPLEIPFMEDLLFCIQAFLKSRTICINNNYFYHYCIRSESASNLYRENLAELQKRVFNEMEILLKKEDCYSISLERLNMRYVDMCISAISNEIVSKKNIVEKLKKIDQLCKDKNLGNIIKNLDISRYTLRKKLVLNMIRYKYSLSLYIYYYLLSIK